MNTDLLRTEKVPAIGYIKGTLYIEYDRENVTGPFPNQAVIGLNEIHTI